MNKLAVSLLVFSCLACAQADDTIKLSSGTVVTTASFAVHPNWKEYFPEDHLFFAEKYPEGNLKGMHSRYQRRLDGASVTLNEDGSLKTLTFYPGGQRQGAVRIYGPKHLVLYAHYKDNEKHGITCLLKGGEPRLVQEWDKGALKGAMLVARKGPGFAAVDDTAQLAEAQNRLSSLEKGMDEAESDLKKRLREWVADEDERFKKAKDALAMKVVKAQHKVREQVIRKEHAEQGRAAADAVARSHQAAINAGSHHPVRDARIAGNARAIRDADKRVSHSASEGIKATGSNAKAITREANHELGHVAQELQEDNAELYRFALAALEKSRLPEDPVSQQSPGSDQGKKKRHHPKK